MPSCLNIAQTILNDMSILLVQIKNSLGYFIEVESVDNSLFSLTLTLFCDILSDGFRWLGLFLALDIYQSCFDSGLSFVHEIHFGVA